MSNSIVATVYSGVIKDVIENVRKDFEDNGVDESVLRELERIWDKKIRNAKVTPGWEAVNGLSNEDPSQNGNNGSSSSIYSQQPSNYQQQPKTDYSKYTPGSETSVQTSLVQQSKSDYGQKFTSGHDVSASNPHQQSQKFTPGSETVQNQNQRQPLQSKSDYSQSYIPGNEVPAPNPHQQPQKFTEMLAQNPRQPQPGQKIYQQQSVQTYQSVAAYPSIAINTMTNNGVGKPSQLTHYPNTSPTQPTLAPSSDRISSAGLMNPTDDQKNKFQQIQQIKPLDPAKLIPRNVINPPQQLPEFRKESSLLDNDDINSDLDDSDEEDNNADGEETQNIILCLYDKVTRTKNKWKCQLKDGIMSVNGRDFLFQKGNGDFEF